MDVTKQGNQSGVCLHNKHGFCKFGQRCRKVHIYEICSENNCEIQTCMKRHPKPCSFYQLYQRCKFGIYCAFMHSESIQSKEIELLKVKVEILEIEKRKKSEEISDLYERLEMVETILAEREQVFDGNNTPKDKDTKKRRKAKQHPTPSPVHHNRDTLGQSIGAEDQSIAADDTDTSDVSVERVLNAEEIAKLYDEKEPDGK